MVVVAQPRYRQSVTGGSSGSFCWISQPLQLLLKHKLVVVIQTDVVEH